MEPYAWRRIYTLRIRQPTSQHPVGSSLVIPKSPQVQEATLALSVKSLLIIKALLFLCTCAPTLAYEKSHIFCLYLQLQFLGEYVNSD